MAAPHVTVPPEMVSENTSLIFVSLVALALTNVGAAPSFSVTPVRIVATFAGLPPSVTTRLFPVASYSTSNAVAEVSTLKLASPSSKTNLKTASVPSPETKDILDIVTGLDVPASVTVN